MSDHETTALVSRLLPIATRFRAALEILKRDWEQIVDDADDRPRKISVFGILQHYPWSCCDKTTLLLVRYLSENGYPEALCVNGYDKRKVSRRHTWVRVGEVHIDLTADQFKRFRPRPDPIIVTAGLQFHSRFKVIDEVRYTAGWAVWKWDADCIAAAEWLYEKVMRLAEDK
jgi:hypothetical protein